MALELTVVAPIIFWLPLLTAVIESDSKVLCILSERFGVRPAADKTTFEPSIAADKVIMSLFPEFTVPYCATKASDPLCTTKASVTPDSAILACSISIVYLAALKDA